MPIYEIINPSDPYTMVAADDEAARLAGIILGQGKLGIIDENDETVLPILIFDAAKYLNEMWPDWEQQLAARLADIANALDSVLIGSRADRLTFDKGLELIEGEDKRSEWWVHWHDGRRSSLNDIGRRAIMTAGGIRNKLAANLVTD